LSYENFIPRPICLDTEHRYSQRTVFHGTMETHMSTNNTKLPGTNRDPITDAPGAHPIGVGLGAAAGGIAAGAAAGTLAAGPIGTVAGAAVGAIAGGLGGKAVAEHFDPTVATVEERHWRSNFHREIYYRQGMTYDDYAPAYRIGGEAHGRYGDASFEDVEDKLANDYQRARGGSRLEWDHAKDATRAAWARVKGQ
jgi:hypothetical protein